LRPVRFHPAARIELSEAVSYYETLHAGLGGDFQAEVEESVRRIARNPRVGAPYKSTELRHVRVRRFPYVVFYLEAGSGLWIVAVAHGKRRPDYWQQRRPD
jgi:toxin ParE1/3/4